MEIESQTDATEPEVKTIHYYLQQCDKLKKSTKKTYKCGIERACRAVFGELWEFDVNAIIDRAAELIDYIEHNEVQPASILRMFQTMLKRNKLDYTAYKAAIQQRKGEQFQHSRPKERKTDENNQPWTWDRVIQRYEELNERWGPETDRTRDEFMATIMLSLAVEQYPLRANELRMCQFTDHGDNNYIDLENKKMVIRNNKAGYPETEYPLSDRLNTLLSFYHTHHNQTDYVFVNRNQQAFSEKSGGLQKVLKRVIGLTMHDLRHLVQDYIQTLSPEEKNTYARNMLHSAATQSTKYTDLK